MVERLGSLLVRAGCAFAYDVRTPSEAVFLVRPDGTGATLDVARESWETTPALAYRDYRDLYGNRCRRLTLAPGRFTLRYDADVAVVSEPAPGDFVARQHSVDELPDDVLLYTLASRFCLSDELADEAWRRFGTLPPGFALVQAICDFVHGHVRFAYGATHPHKTASDVLRDGTGVCRDFTHLAIAFCRALSIPARYVFGYLPDIDVPPPTSPMDFCAWFEVYLGDRWWTFDARNNARRIGNIVIARGRDAGDVPMVTTYGDARFESMTVWADRVG
ncbi:MAG: transglutaminase family protein [Vulcanimicrobiaceae bacterium]